MISTIEKEKKSILSAIKGERKERKRIIVSYRASIDCCSPVPEMMTSQGVSSSDSMAGYGRRMNSAMRKILMRMSDVLDSLKMRCDAMRSKSMRTSPRQKTG